MRKACTMRTHLVLVGFIPRDGTTFARERRPGGWLAGLGRSHGARHLFHGFIWVTRSSPCHVFLLDLDWTGGDRYITVICSAYLLQLEIYKYLLRITYS
jgi:hypothetical protein